LVFALNELSEVREFLRRELDDVIEGENAFKAPALINDREAPDAV
jgi:hypothetical protein